MPRKDVELSRSRNEKPKTENSFLASRGYDVRGLGNNDAGGNNVADAKDYTTYAADQDVSTHVRWQMDYRRQAYCRKKVAVVALILALLGVAVFLGVWFGYMGWVPDQILSNDDYDMQEKWASPLWEFKKGEGSRGLRIWTGTYNLDHRTPKAEELQSWFDPEGAYGTVRTNWVPRFIFVGVQESIFPGGHRRWFRMLQEAVSARWPEDTFEIVARVARVSQNCILLANSKIIPEVHSVTVSSRMFLWGRGGIAINAWIGDTSLSFVSSQLTPDMDSYEHRNSMYGWLTRLLRLGPDSFPVLTVADHTIWVGDLSYRVNDQTWDDLTTGNMSNIYAEKEPHDQLRQAMMKNEAFQNFKEAGKIEFSPTFQHEPDAPVDPDGHRPFEKRRTGQVPAWTDRILFHSLPNMNKERKLKLEPVSKGVKGYNSAPMCTTSDHTPVYALFDLEVEDISNRIAGTDVVTLKLSELRFATTDGANDERYKVFIYCEFCKETPTTILRKETNVDISIEAIDGFMLRHIEQKYLRFKIVPRMWWGDKYRELAFAVAKVSEDGQSTDGAPLKRAIKVYRGDKEVGELHFTLQAKTVSQKVLE